MESAMRVAVVQTSPVFGEPTRNIRDVIALMEAFPAGGSRLSGLRPSSGEARHDDLLRLDVSGERPDSGPQRRPADRPPVKSCYALLPRCNGDAVLGEPGLCSDRQSCRA